VLLQLVQKAVWRVPERIHGTQRTSDSKTWGRSVQEFCIEDIRLGSGGRDCRNFGPSPYRFGGGRGCTRGGIRTHLFSDLCLPCCSSCVPRVHDMPETYVAT
jgi:hypothetical protein